MDVTASRFSRDAIMKENILDNGVTLYLWSPAVEKNILRDVGV
ncbi:hypothetical protein Tco_0814849, partial [Tanacetum coccineum]